MNHRTADFSKECVLLLLTLTVLGLGVLKARAIVEAQRKLAGEKGALVNTVRKLNRDIAKLEGFKRNLLTTLQANEEVTLHEPEIICARHAS